MTAWNEIMSRSRNDMLSACSYMEKRGAFSEERNAWSVVRRQVANHGPIKRMLLVQYSRSRAVLHRSTQWFSGRLRLKIWSSKMTRTTNGEE